MGSARWAGMEEMAADAEIGLVWRVAATERVRRPRELWAVAEADGSEFARTCRRKRCKSDSRSGARILVFGTNHSTLCAGVSASPMAAPRVYTLQWRARGRGTQEPKHPR